MQRRTLLAGTAALAATPLTRVAAQAPAEKTKIVWWHAMTAALGEQVNRIVEAFNQSQSAIEVQAIYKGGYADVLTATIAAFRAGQAPHLAQIFEVGTGSMLAAGKATKQVWELVKETGVAIDPEGVHPGGARLLQPGGWTDGVDAVQLLYRGDVVQQGCVPQGGARSRQAAGDLARCGQGGPGDQGEGRGGNPGDQFLAELDPARTIQRAARHSVRQQGRWVRGAGRAARDQQQGACEAHAAAARHGEGWHVQIRRARQPAGSVAGIGQGGHPFQLVRACAATW